MLYNTILFINVKEQLIYNLLLKIFIVKEV